MKEAWLSLSWKPPTVSVATAKSQLDIGCVSIFP